MTKIFRVMNMTILLEIILFSIFSNTSLAQFYGTHIYAIQIENENQGYLRLTFNPDGTIIGEARILSEEYPLPLIGIYGRTIFIIKYKLSNNTEILDHCRFISEVEFIGFERYKKNGIPIKEIAKVFGSRRDNI